PRPPRRPPWSAGGDGHRRSWGRPRTPPPTPWSTGAHRCRRRRPSAGSPPPGRRRHPPRRWPPPVPRSTSGRPPPCRRRHGPTGCPMTGRPGTRRPGGFPPEHVVRQPPRRERPRTVPLVHQDARVGGEQAHVRGPPSVPAVPPGQLFGEHGGAADLSGGGVQGEQRTRVVLVPEGDGDGPAVGGDA